MKDETVEKLAIAKQFNHHASFAGVARQGIADSYSAIDAVFSALLVEIGEVPPRNHKAKLDKVRSLYPSLLDERVEHFEGGGASYAGGVPWDRIEEHYRLWLQSRYETFELSAGETRKRIADAFSVENFAIQQLAEADGDDQYDLAERVTIAAFGYPFSKTNEAVGMAHDHLFNEAECMGEMMGSKLGTKIASATNFSDFDFIAGDNITRKIIEEDPEIAEHAARVYREFVNLAEEIRGKRLAELAADIDEPTMPELNDSTSFMFSMKAKYHGEMLAETAASYTKTMQIALGRLLSRREGD